MLTYAANILRVQQVNQSGGAQGYFNTHTWQPRVAIASSYYRLVNRQSADRGRHLRVG